MLAFYRLIGILAASLLLIGCGADVGEDKDSEDIVISYRERIDIHSLGDAEDHSVVIEAAYDPALPDAELLICIPRPVDTPIKVKGGFSFSFYEDETRLFWKGVDSVVEDGKFETFFLLVNADFLDKLRVHMEYPETDDFKATGDMVKSYNIFFDQIAAELIQMETDLSHGRDPLQPPPLPSCLDARNR